MARLIFVANVSLDGHVEDPQGRIDWSAPDDEVFAFITDLIRPAGTHLYGRRMYDALALWETDPALVGQSALSADFAAVWQAADKIVYSRTLDRVWTARTRLERAFDAAAVAALKASADRDLTVGGADLAGQALQAGLVDECHLLVRPILVGGGKPALPAGVRAELELLDERRVGRDVAYLRYGVRVDLGSPDLNRGGGRPDEGSR